MMHYEGEAHVVGALRLRTRATPLLGPAELEYRGGQLTSGPYDVLGDMRGKLFGNVDDFDVEPVNDMGRLLYSDHLRSRAPSVASWNVVNFLRASSPAFDLQDGSGLVTSTSPSITASSPGSRLSYPPPTSGCVTHGLPFRLDGEIEPSQPALGSSREAIWFRHPPSGSSSRRANAKPPPPPAQRRSRARNIEPRRHPRLPLTRSQAHAEQIVLPDLEWLDDLPFARPRDWNFKGGHGRIRGCLPGINLLAVDASLSAGFADSTVITDKLKINGGADLLATAHVSAARSVTIMGRMLSQKIEIATDEVTASFLNPT